MMQREEALEHVIRGLRHVYGVVARGAVFVSALSAILELSLKQLIPDDVERHLAWLPLRELAASQSTAGIVLIAFVISAGLAGYITFIAFPDPVELHEVDWTG